MLAGIDAPDRQHDAGSDHNAKQPSTPRSVPAALSPLPSPHSSSCSLSIPSTTTMAFGPLGLSLAPWIRSRPAVYRYFKPFANWYANLMGYRKLGLRYDDLRTCGLCGIEGDDR